MAGEEAAGESLFAGVALDVHPATITAHTRIMAMHTEMQKKLFLSFIFIPESKKGLILYQNSDFIFLILRFWN
jgi:hypothetical protein